MNNFCKHCGYNLKATDTHLKDQPQKTPLASPSEVMETALGLKAPGEQVKGPVVDEGKIEDYAQLIKAALEEGDYEAVAGLALLAEEEQKKNKEEEEPKKE